MSVDQSRTSRSVHEISYQYSSASKFSVKTSTNSSSALASSFSHANDQISEAADSICSKVSIDRALVNAVLEAVVELVPFPSTRSEYAAKKRKGGGLNGWLVLQLTETEVRLFAERLQSKCSSSLMIATQLFEKGTEWKALTIRTWAGHYVVHHSLPKSKHGRHQKVRSTIDSEDVRLACFSWLKSVNPNQIKGSSFAEVGTRQSA